MKRGLKSMRRHFQWEHMFFFRVSPKKSHQPRFGGFFPPPQKKSLLFLTRIPCCRKLFPGSFQHMYGWYIFSKDFVHESFRWVSSPRLCLWTTCPHLSHWNHQGWFTHLNDPWVVNHQVSWFLRGMEIQQMYGWYFFLIWRFPEMGGTPKSSSYLDWDFFPCKSYKSSILGVLRFMEICILSRCFAFVGSEKRGCPVWPSAWRSVPMAIGNLRTSSRRRLGVFHGETFFMGMRGLA